MDAVSSRNSKLRSRRSRSNRKVAVAPTPPEDAAAEQNHDRPENSPHHRRRRQKKSHPTRSRKGRGDERPPKSRSSPARKRRGERTGIPRHERSKYVALDCEMVGVGEHGLRSAVGRVCVLNWDGDVLLDTYVRVVEPVSDYRTYVSGIREEHLSSGDAVSFEECQSMVSALLEGKVLVGHALKNDLRVLDIEHPWHDIRDTAKYGPFMKTRFDDGVLWPRRLKELAWEKLGRTIQVDGVEHSPVEDAMAALDLYKSVRNKWEKVMEYKMKRTREITMQKEAAGSTMTADDSPAALPVQ